MKRDLKLCQEILLTLERDENLDCNDKIYYHLLLLADAKYISLVGSSADYTHEKGHKYFTKGTARLTWTGHDVLDNIFNEKMMKEYPVTPAYGWKSVWDV